MPYPGMTDSESEQFDLEQDFEDDRQNLELENQILTLFNLLSRDAKERVIQLLEQIIEDDDDDE